MEASSENISLEQQRKKRSFYELLIAAVLLVLILTGAWIQLTVYALDSWIFIVLFNINSLFMLIVLFLVGRNVVKLVMERRRKVFGAKMRTRLVLIFVSLTLIPTVLMFLAANRVVITSVDYWFTKQIEDSFDAAIDVGKNFYDASANRQEHYVKMLLQEIDERKMLWNGRAMNNLLEKKQEEYNLELVGTISADLQEQNWHIKDDFTAIWGTVKDAIDWQHVATNTFGSLLWATNDADYVIGVRAIDKGKSGYILTAQRIGQGILTKIDGISEGFKEYAQLKELKKPLRVSFMLILGILGMIIIFGGVWFGFRLSKELTAPILALAKGTNRLAQGELDVRIADAGHDELNQLIDSFNSMAKDLQEGQESLKEANSQLAKQHANVANRNTYIETILDTITTGVVTLDISGNVVTMNKAVHSLFELSDINLVGRHPQTFLGAEYASLINEMLGAIRLDPKKAWSDTIDLSIGDKTWKLIVYAVALFHEGSVQGFVLVLDDITELAKMQRMAAWREVARRIAHEIKNPLTPIKLSAQRLERKFNTSLNDPVFTQCTEVIIKQVDRLQFMVKEFSSFANVPEIDLQAGSLGALIAEIYTLFKSSHAHIEWHINIEEDLPAIRLDSAALYRALMNIVSNALEAMVDSEKQELSIEAKHMAEEGIISLSIMDSGPGLKHEDRERLFEPYFTTKPGGTGLGMTIVKTIISDHHASIFAKTNPSGGTNIVMKFPVC